MSRGLISAGDMTGMQETIASTWDREAVILEYGPGAPDRFGDPTLTWVPVGVPIPCGLALSGAPGRHPGREMNQDRATQTMQWLGRFAPDVALSGLDRVMISDPNPPEGWAEDGLGTVFEVVGPPERRGTHLHVELLDVEGA
jgi:hypothetical protein